MAIKWLGNVGSHGRVELTRDDVADGLDILEHILVESFDRRTERLKRIEREMIRRKGRPKKVTLRTIG